jgi:hypothetical protein
MFPQPDFEPPNNDPSWALIAGLVAAAFVCAIVIAAVGAR